MSCVSFIERIASCLPSAPTDAIQWEELEDACLPVGGVCDRALCERLFRTPAFYTLSERQRTELFLAVLLQDAGEEELSPYAVSRMARTCLWESGLCGTPEKMALRETVCALVAYLKVPFSVTEQEDPVRRVREIAAIGQLAPDFHWQLLCMLAKLCACGEPLANIQRARDICEKAGCLQGPCAFADQYTQRAYFAGRNIQPTPPLHNASWGEVILLSGLPGTGKDTWIQRSRPYMRMVSLDAIRAELHILPTQAQEPVMQMAYDRARACLRQKRPFVWNATNLSRNTRQRLVGFFERYGARVRIVYLETDQATQKARNLSRDAVVPEDVVNRMRSKTVPPMPDEAQTVEWICV